MFHYTELDCFRNPSILHYFKIANEPSYVDYKEHSRKVLNPKLTALHFEVSENKPLSDKAVQDAISRSFLLRIFGKDSELFHPSSVFMDNRTYSSSELMDVAAKERFRMSAYQNEPDILWFVPPPIFDHIQKSRDEELLSLAVIYRYHSDEWVLFGNLVIPVSYPTFSGSDNEMYAMHGILSRAIKITIGDYVLRKGNRWTLLYRFDVIDENALRIFKFNWIEPKIPVYSPPPFLR